MTEERLDERYWANNAEDDSITFSRSQVEQKLMSVNNFDFTYKRWEVYKAYVAFDDFEDTFKARPILVFTDNGDTVTAFKCSSKRYPHESYYEKLPIEEWQMIGLTKPTYVCLTGKIEIDKRYIYKKVGKLKSSDIDSIKEIILG